MEREQNKNSNLKTQSSKIQLFWRQSGIKVQIFFFIFLIGLFCGCVNNVVLEPSYYETGEFSKCSKKVSFYVKNIDNQTKIKGNRDIEYSNEKITIRLPKSPERIISEAFDQVLGKLGILAKYPDLADYLIDIRIEKLYFQAQQDSPTTLLSFVGFIYEKEKNKNIVVLRSEDSSSSVKLNNETLNLSFNKVISTAVSDFVINGIIPVAEKTDFLISSDTEKITQENTTDSLISSDTAKVVQESIKPLLGITLNHKNLISVKYSFAPWPEPHTIEYAIGVKDPYIDSYFELETSYGAQDKLKREGTNFYALHSFSENAFASDSELLTLIQKIPYADTTFTSQHKIGHPNSFKTMFVYRFGGLYIDKRFFGKPLNDSIPANQMPGFIEFTIGKVSPRTKIELSSLVLGIQRVLSEYEDSSMQDGGTGYRRYTGNVRTFYGQEKLNITTGKRLVPWFRVLGGGGGELRYGAQFFDDYAIPGVENRVEFFEYSPFLKTGIGLGNELTLEYERHFGKYSQQAANLAYHSWVLQTDLSLIWDKNIQRVYVGTSIISSPYTANSKSSWDKLVAYPAIISAFIVSVYCVLGDFIASFAYLSD